MYTSGSTGVPKGVLVEQRSVVRLVQGSDFFHLGGSDRLLQTGSMSFDAATFEVWGALLNGACLYLTGERTLLDPGTLARTLADEAITTLWLTSSWFNQLVDQDVTLFAPLRHLLVGGEALSPEHVHRVRRAHPHLLVTNGYGPTENTTFSTTHAVEADDDPIPIGRPIANSEVYVLDHHLRLQPLGVPGEICVGGAGVARGYWNDEALTAARFVASPFGAGERLYRTGDLGRWDDSGRLLFLGRADEQIKIRGFRVEPAEIERALTAHEAVGAAAVALHDEPSGTKVLVAYLTASRPLVAADLVAWLRRTLPDYMVPGHFVQLDELPLTRNGKLDRAALPPWGEAGLPAARTHVAPRDELEAALARVWQEVLSVDRVGVEDHFFERGGHSLKAAQLAARVHRDLGRELRIQEVFTEPTVARQAALLRARDRSVLGRIEPVPERESYDLSHGQRRLWVVDSLDQDRVAYIIPLAFRLQGALDVAALAAALEAVIARHEILRTRFVTMGDQPQQVIVAPGRTRLEYCDVSGDADPPGSARALAEREAATPFDLERGPLVRGKLVRLADRDHVLLFTVHHIVCDGWSFDILMREIAARYRAELAGTPDGLAPLRIQHRDYVAWQRRLLAGDRVGESRRWWHEQFRGSIPRLELPLDLPRPRVRSYRGAIYTMTLGPEVTGRLTGLGAAEDATLFMVLVSLVHVLLARYSGQDDIVVGTPIAGRHHPDLDDQVGYFVNTLALRNRLDPEAGFRTFLRQVRERTAAAIEHQQYPFDTLVGELDVERDTSRSPLFDVMVVLQNMGQALPALEGIEAGLFPTPLHVVKHDLEITFVPAGEGLQVAFNYCTELFYPSTAARMADHFACLVAAVVSAPERPIAELELASAAERRLVLEAFTQTRTPRHDGATLPELLAAVAARHPAHTAVECDGRAMSYAELWSATQRLAHHLRHAYGVGRDARVAVMMDRSEQQLVATLAVLVAGGAYVPIDPDYPEERIRAMLDDTEPHAIVTEAAYLFDLGSATGKLFAMDIQASELATPERDLELVNEPDDLAYVMYTSGSSGRPKGVMVTHRGVARLVRDTDYVALSAEDRVLGLSSFCFDGSTFDVYAALLHGAALVIAQRGAILEPEALGALIRERGVTRLFVTTALFNTLVDHALDCFTTVGTVLFGGEQVSVEHVRAFVERHGSGRLVHVYGPTENTTFSTWHTVTAVDEGASTIPIGKPIANTSALVLDDRLRPVPIGVRGEIYLGGAGLARGYLNDAVLTAARFVAHPFEPGARLYRTGDVGRWDTEGNLVFLGRRDAQLKVRGFRVEPGEIEHWLEAHDAIRQAAVALVHDGAAETLCGYFTADRELAGGEVRSWLARQLPDYMIPAHLVQLDALPVTAHGKVDKSALPRPGASAGHGASFVAPRNDLEAELVEIWREHLGRDRLGVSDNYFALGGDSIRAIVLVHVIRQRLGLHLEVKDIFVHQDVASLAARLAGAQGGDHGAEAAAARAEVDALCRSIVERPELRARLPADREDVYPMSDVQKGMVFHSTMDDRSGVYHDQIVHRLIDPTFDRRAFESAYRSLVEKHAILRTSFHFGDFPEPLQVVHPAASFALDIEYEDLSHLDERAQQDYLRAFTAADRRRPLPLSQPGLWRTRVFRLDASELAVLRVFHHAILDGWSDASFMTELSRLYFARKTDPEHPAEPLAATYRDYIVDQRRIQRAPAVAAWWRQHLAGHDRTPLPLGKVAPGAPVRLDKDVHSTYLAAGAVEALRALSAATGTSVKDICLAAFTYLVKVTTNRSDLTVGLLTHGRPDVEDGDKIVGCFLNSVPFRVTIPAAVDGRSLVADVKRRSSRLKAYDKLSLLAIAELVDAERVGTSPLFDIFFGYFDFHVYDAAAAESGLKQSRMAGHAVTNTLFDCFVVWEGEALRVSLTALAGLYDGPELARLSRYYLAILRALCERLDERLTHRAVMGDDEVAALLAIGRGPQRGTVPATLGARFAATAAARPEQAAVVCEGAAMSYVELERRSARVARRLRRAGLSAGDLVAVLLPRRSDLVVALLGILRAGCAYVPLDPGGPENRIRFMMEDSGARVLVTDRAGLPAWAALASCVDIAEACAEDDRAEDEGGPGEWGRPDGAAYLMYTSGSSGQPKGVVVTHDNVATFAENLAPAFGFAPGQRILASTRYTFDISALETLCALDLGLTVVLATDAEVSDAQRLAALIRAERVDLLQFTPSLLQLLLDAVGDGFLRGVSVMLVGGEALPDGLAARLRGLAGVRVLNVYGPTEATIWSTAWELDSGPVRIGRPLAEEEARVLGHDLELLPRGVVGELFLAGRGVARGYHRRPDLTAARFVADPFAEAGARAYRTGDLARWCDDGTLEFLGRTDDQVKVRGHRVELGEIEAKLMDHPRVTRAVAVLRAEDGAAHTVAYYCGAEPLDEDELRRHLERDLPQATIPARFTYLVELPLTAHGKIDRAALPDPAPRAERSHAEPRGEAEQLLAAVWCGVLGVPRVGRHDNFFDLGGDSIKAMLVAARLFDRGVTLDVADVFRQAQIADLAPLLRPVESGPPEPVAPAPPAAVDPGFGGSRLTAEELDAILASVQPSAERPR
jgi:tyrocidine synthetase III